MGELVTDIMQVHVNGREVSIDMTGASDHAEVNRRIAAAGCACVVRALSTDESVIIARQHEERRRSALLDEVMSHGEDDRAEALRMFGLANRDVRELGADDLSLVASMLRPESEDY